MMSEADFERALRDYAAQLVEGIAGDPVETSAVITAAAVLIAAGVIDVSEPGTRGQLIDAVVEEFAANIRQIIANSTGPVTAQA